MERLVRFVSSCVGTDGYEPSTSSSTGQVQVTDQADGVIVGLATVCQYLASKTDAGRALTSVDALASTQILEWLLWVSTELTPLMDDKLVKLNDFLSTRTYLVGNTLTLADVVVYGAVQPAAAAFPVAQTLHFCNLLRWADLLQHTLDKRGFFPRFSFQRLRYHYVPPAPPVKASSPTIPASLPAAPAAGPGPGPGSKASAPAASAAKCSSAAAAPAPAASSPQAPAAEASTQAPPPAAKEPKPKPAKKPEAAAKPGDASEVSISMLDIRVGTIVKVDKHPNADALYLEEIDVGEDKPRQVISGLVKFVPKEQMDGRRVLVVLNLKPAKMRDVMSYGMVLCASTEEHDRVEPVAVPAGVPNGERVIVEGYDASPLDEVNPKHKILERLFPDLKTDAEGVATYKGAPFVTSQGKVTSTLTNAWVK